MSAAGRIAKPIDIGKVANPPPVLPPDRSQVFRRRARRRFDRLAARQHDSGFPLVYGGDRGRPIGSARIAASISSAGDTS